MHLFCSGDVGNSVDVRFFRHRIVAKFAGERVAAREAFCAQPHTTRDAKALDGFVGVAGTGRVEAAAASKENGEIRFIKTQREERDFDGPGMIVHR